MRSFYRFIFKKEKRDVSLTAISDTCSEYKTMDNNEETYESDEEADTTVAIDFFKERLIKGPTYTLNWFCHEGAGAASL